MALHRLLRTALALLSFTSVALGALQSPVAASHAPDADEIALGSLVDAEMAFARMGWERGVRAAFLANFAPDGIVFEPTPTRLHEAWNARRGRPLASRVRRCAAGRIVTE